MQTRISGAGRGVSIRLAREEIMRIDMKGDKLGWTQLCAHASARASLSAPKRAQALAPTLVSGEGIQQTFEGHGSVWIAPTQGIYEKRARAQGLEGLTGAPGSSNTATHTK